MCYCYHYQSSPSSTASSITIGECGGRRRRRAYLSDSILCVVIVLGCIWPKKDRENVWTILYVCALVTIDFMYEFYAKRALFVEHQIEDREHLTEEEVELQKLLETLTGSQLHVTVPVGLKQGDSFNVNGETITVPHGFVAGASPRLAASNRLREVRKKLKNIGSSVEDARARARSGKGITAAKAKLAAARRARLH